MCYSKAIIEGWKSEDVLVSTYDDMMYHFYDKPRLFTAQPKNWLKAA